MKEVKNAKLRRILEREGIKDVVIWFVDGVAKAVSDDDFTDTILHYAYENQMYVPSFNQMSIEEWADFVRGVFDEGLREYNAAQEHIKEREKEGGYVLKVQPGNFHKYRDEDEY